jgi:hypothetical protein
MSPMAKAQYITKTFKYTCCKQFLKVAQGLNKDSYQGKPFF